MGSGTGDDQNVAIASYDNSQAGANNCWAYYKEGDVDGDGTNDTTDTFTSGKGYSVKMQEAGDISFTGTLHTANVTIALTQGGASGNNFNLVGNPFTAYLNLGEFFSDNTDVITGASAYFWNGVTSSYDTKTYGIHSEYKIAPGQGFFVEATANNANLTFDINDVSHQSNDTFQRTTSARPEINLNLSDGHKNTFTKVYYIEGTTSGYDLGYDGRLFGGVSYTFTIFSDLVESDGNKYQFQSLPNQEHETMVIPIGVNAKSGKEITFTAATMNLPSDIKVYLEDRETNTFTRLDEANSNYKLNVTDDLNGIGRFYLHTTQSALRVPEVVLDNVSIYKTDASTLRIIGLQQGNAKLSLYNMLGKQMMNTSFSSSGVTDISLPKLAKGMYIVQLQTDAGRVNKKIILE